MAPLDPAARALLFTEARTTGAFTEEPVTHAQLAELQSLAQWPPTSANTNPLRWLVIRTPAARARLLEHVKRGNRPRVERAPLTVVLAADLDFHEHLPQLHPQKPRMRERFAADPAHRERTARDNAWLQAGYVLLAARAVGLAAGPMGGFDASGLDADLLAGTGWRSFLLVNLGRPAPEGAWGERLPRLAYDQVVREL